jgi:transposase
MVAATDTFSPWLAQAQVPEHALTAEQRAVLQAAFRFRRSRGADYYSSRLLSHFLLHCGSGLKVAQLARLVGVSRPTASRQQGLSSKEAIQQARHRMDGRPYGKLLPRYAGPIAQFLCTHPWATRYDLLDFIDHTFDVRVSRVALYRFLKKYGLDRVPEQECGAGTAPAAAPVPATALDAVPAPPFYAGTRATPVPSC